MERRRMSAAAWTVLLVASGLCTAIGAGPAAKAIHWHGNLAAAHELAVKESRPLLIVFGGPNCVYCRKLDKETFHNKFVAEFVGKNFVAVKLDIERDQKIADVLEVKSLPTTVILSPNADLLGTIVGYVKTDRYKKSLTAALEFQELLRKQASR